MLSSDWSNAVAGSGNGWISTDSALPRPETTQALQRVAIVLTDGQNDPGSARRHHADAVVQRLVGCRQQRAQGTHAHAHGWHVARERVDVVGDGHQRVPARRLHGDEEQRHHHLRDHVRGTTRRAASRSSDASSARRRATTITRRPTRRSIRSSSRSRAISASCDSCNEPRARDASRGHACCSPFRAGQPEIFKESRHAREENRGARTPPSAQASRRARRPARSSRKIDHIREGKHGAKSAKQAIAIGLSEARRSGVGVKAPKKGATSEATRKKAAKDTAAGPHKTKKSASTESKSKRSAVATRVLEREGTKAASHTALSRQAHASASRRSAADRSAAAKKGWATRRKAAAAKGASSSGRTARVALKPATSARTRPPSSRAPARRA